VNIGLLNHNHQQRLKYLRCCKRQWWSSNVGYVNKIFNEVISHNRLWY
jgi:hypothetical protein